MSADACDDIAELLESLGFGTRGIDIFTTVDFDMKGELRGILVEAANPGTMVDALIDTDTVGVDLTISKGEGDMGRLQTSNLSFAIFKALDLQTDVTVDGTDYLCIQAANTPYEIKRDGRYYRAFRLEVTRYYGGITA